MFDRTSRKREWADFGWDCYSTPHTFRAPVRKAFALVSQQLSRSNQIETSTLPNRSGWNPLKSLPAETSQHRSQVIQHKYLFRVWVCALSFQDSPVAIAKINNVWCNFFRDVEFTRFERLRIETIQSICTKSQGVRLEVTRSVNWNWILGKFSIGSWERLLGLTIWSVYQWVDIQVYIYCPFFILPNLGSQLVNIWLFFIFYLIFVSFLER